MVRSRAVSQMTVMTHLTGAVGPNHAIAPMIVPPDGGWGWVIVIAGLLGSCCVDGCVYCFYIFREPMSKELKVKQAEVSYLSSINTGFYFLGAVFACSFGNHWGFRATMMLGGIVTSLSYASGYFYQEILYYHLTVGVLGGLGSGFISVGGSLPASFYFDKKRSIALGIASCGSGLGGVIMPHVIESFMSHHGWRNTFLFEGGVLAFTIILGALIRPLKPVMVVIKTDSSKTTLRASEDSIMDFSAFRIPPLLNPELFSVTSIARSVVVNREDEPTIAQLADDLNNVDIRMRETSRYSIFSRIQEMTQSRQTSQVLQPSVSLTLLSNIFISDEPLIRERLPWYKCGCCRSKYITLPGRPLMRNDLYYTGSLMRLPEYAGRDKDLDYHMHVTRVPTYYQTVQDLTRNYTIWCCHNIFTGLRYLIDYTMFKSPSFICLGLCGFGVYMAFYSPYVFGRVHLEQYGAGEYSSTLISMIGGGSMIGRLLSGLIIATCPKFDARTVVSFMLLVSGISIVCMVLHPNLYYKGACLFVFGFTIGFYVPLRSLIIVDFFGLQRLTAATGVLILCLGVGSFMGPPIAEVAMDCTNDPNAPFYVCGISLVLSAVSLLPMKKFNKWERKRAVKKKRLGRSQQV